MGNEQDNEQQKTKQRYRKHGEGTIIQRKDGRYQATISLEAGKRKSYYRKTYKEAVEALQEARRELKQGVLAIGPQQKLKEYLEYWLEQVHKAKIRISTYEQYRTILDKHLIPGLGHIPIQKLTAQQLQSFYTKKRSEGLSAGRIRHIHAVLHRALDHAMRITPPLVSRKVSESVELPRQEQREIQTLTQEQAQQLLTATRKHHLLALVTLALTTGMRKGELLGLQWKDIDWQQGHLQVRRTVSYITGLGFIVGEPKTAKSKRRISLPQLVIETLKEHRTMQKEARLKAGASWVDLDIVFCNTQGNYIHPQTLGENFSKLLTEVGLPQMLFHDLRHSAATLLLEMGINVKVVQELLGHSNVSMTLNVYSHVQPSMQKEAMGKMDDLFRHQRNQHKTEKGGDKEAP